MKNFVTLLHSQILIAGDLIRSNDFFLIEGNYFQITFFFYDAKILDWTMIFKNVIIKTYLKLHGNMF